MTRRVVPQSVTSRAFRCYRLTSHAYYVFWRDALHSDVKRAG